MNPKTLTALVLFALAASRYPHAQTDQLTVHTPDAHINQAFEWSKSNLDRSGANAPVNAMAASAIGQLQLVRSALMLLTQQNDSPSFLLLAFHQYWLVSGDDAFLRESWPRLQSALTRYDPQTASVHTVAIWVAAIEGMQQMARALKDQPTFALATQLVIKAQQQLDAAMAAGSTGVYAEATALAMGFVDPADADSILQNFHSTLPFLGGLIALGHYRYHREWAAYDRLRTDAPRTPAPQPFFAAALFVIPFVRGTLGWETDAPRRAAALEPHLPAEWTHLRAAGLRVGRERLEMNIARERGEYAVTLHRLTVGPPLSVRVSPALPLGARVDRIVVNDRDVATQVEETAHDVHPVAEMQLGRDAQIEFHYSGGIEILSDSALKVLDFRREGRDYVMVVEGASGTSATVQLRSEMRVRRVLGSDSLAQSTGRLQIHTSFPAGAGVVRKLIRIRT